MTKVSGGVMAGVMSRLRSLSNSWKRTVAAGRSYRAAARNGLLLSGTIAARQLLQLNRISCLADAEFRVCSQWGEDGIVEWLVSRLPGIPETFVEFGVEDYTEANTRFLLQHRNWRGLVMDQSEACMVRLRDSDLYWRHQLTARAAFITSAKVDALIEESGPAGDLGILSIDIDGNDYWVWQAIQCVKPWLVIVEYNAVLGDLRPLTIPYTPSFDGVRAHSSNLYFGASIAALQRLAGERGYTLLGSNRAGCNAFFLRSDLMERLEGVIDDRAPRPSLFRGSRGEDGSLTWLSGLARLDAIARMRVLDVATLQETTLAEAGELYSERWKSLMGVGVRS